VHRARSLVPERDDPISSRTVGIVAAPQSGLRLQGLLGCVCLLSSSAPRVGFETIDEIARGRELQERFNGDTARWIEAVRPGAVLQKSVLTRVCNEIIRSTMVGPPEPTNENRKEIRGKTIQRYGVAVCDSMTHLAYVALIDSRRHDRYSKTTAPRWEELFSAITHRTERPRRIATYG
jgi:hypothetical protein